MKQVPIRLGPLALLLTVVTICMTVLGILTFSTARADLAMAEKQAAFVQKRYELEMEGQGYLCALQRSNCREIGEDGLSWYTAQKDGLSLKIGVTSAGEIACWQYSSDWQAPEEIGGLWSGE